MAQLEKVQTTQGNRTHTQYLVKKDEKYIGIITELHNLNDWRVFSLVTGRQLTSDFKKDIFETGNLEEILLQMHGEKINLFTDESSSPQYFIVITTNIGSKYYMAIDHNSGGHPWFPKEFHNAEMMTKERAEAALERIKTGKDRVNFSFACEEYADAQIMKSNLSPV